MIVVRPAVDATVARTVEPPRRRRRRVARYVLAVIAVFAVVALGVGVVYADQMIRFLTHLKGSPTSTVAYEPFPPDGEPDYRIVVLGDVGEAGERLTATAKTVVSLSEPGGYDVMLLLGDNVYPAGDPRGLDEVVFQPFAPLLDRGTRLLAVLGNHDVAEGYGDAQMRTLGMSGRWWAESLGDDVLIVGLDSNDVQNPEQRKFLAGALAASDATWKIVALHHPPYSAGYQGSSLDVREAFTPLFERYGVQLVLSGHDHDYQRSLPVNEVVYVVSGGVARSRRTGEEDFTAVSFSWHHFVDLSVFDDHLLIRAVNQDRRVADEATIPP
jgi:UDP-2,3-diacylglucosamine pyrophosphatase LpxH